MHFEGESCSFMRENQHFDAFWRGNRHFHVYWRRKSAFWCSLKGKIGIFMKFWRGKTAFCFNLRIGTPFGDRLPTSKCMGMLLDCVFMTFLDLGGKVYFRPPKSTFWPLCHGGHTAAKFANWGPIWTHTDRFPNSKCMRECFWTRMLTPQTHIWPSWT